MDVVAVDFDGFFARHHAEMVRALSLTLGDVEFGRDAAAEGFARALQRWSTVSTYENPAGWVYRVGLNWATIAATQVPPGADRADRRPPGAQRDPP